MARSAAGVRHLVDEGEARGVAAEACLCGTGIDPVTPYAVGAVVQPWQEVAVAQNLVGALSGTAGLGLALGARRSITTYGPAALAMLSASSVREALDIASEHPTFSLVLTRTSIVDDVPDGSSAYLDGEHLPGDARRVLVERDLASALGILRFVTGRRVQPRRVDIAFSDDGSTGAWRRLLGSTPTFGAKATRVVLPRDLLQSATTGADPHALWLARDQMARMVEERRVHATMRAQVLELVRRASPDVPTLEQLAATLLTPARTLRRRLHAEGTSLRLLVAQVRSTAACSLLAAGGLSVEQVAWRLGYSDATAFAHAFRRWTGVSPGRYRREVSGRP